MAHGQSNARRRAGWLAVACSLAATVGCKGPEKDDSKTLDPATKQKLLGLNPAPKGMAGTAGLDQRFDRTVPNALPKPQIATTNPNPAGAGMPPMGSQVGLVSAPTQPTNPASFGGPRSGDVARPQPPVDPIVQTGGIAPKVPAPLVSGGSPLPPALPPGPASGPPSESGFGPKLPVELPSPSGPATSPHVLPAPPLQNLTLPPEPPAGAFQPPVPPLPGDAKFPEVPSFPPGPLPPPPDLPPLGGK